MYMYMLATATSSRASAVAGFRRLGGRRRRWSRLGLGRRLPLRLRLRKGRFLRYDTMYYTIIYYKILTYYSIVHYSIIYSSIIV